MTIAEALTELGTIVTQCVTWITGNDILFILFVAGLIPAGFMVIRKAKKTSRS